MDIEAIRKRAGITLAELARRVGVSDGHIADLKSGRRNLTIDLAVKLEKTTGASGIVDEVVRKKIAGKPTLANHEPAGP